MRRNRIARVLAIAMLTLTAACARGGEQAATPGPGERGFVIGYAAALTGGLAPFDAPFKDGLEVAIQLLNAEGGIDGRIPIRLEVKDVKSDAALASQVAQELIDSGIDLLITGCDVDLSIASGSVAQAAGVPAISSCATTPTVPAAVGDYMFLVGMGDNAQAAVDADFAMKQGWGTAYVLGSPDTGYTAKLPEYFKEAYTAEGGEIVGEDTFSVGATDYSAQVAKIGSLRPAPDVIFTPAYVPDSAVFMKQLRAAGIDIPVLSTDGNDSPLLIKVGGKAVEDMVFTTHGFPTPGSPLERFYEEYERIKGEPPESVFAALGGDLVAVVDAAVSKAGSTDPKAVRDAIDSLEDVQGVTGSLTYRGQNGVPLKNVYLVKVEAGEFRFVASEVPSGVPSP
ncbi:MAG TPA: ABC transporter substrate-binding protein [Actinomycetota bacterium]|nr:ABC transporter substrate-binding protein [Actinomycetota bacterium]